MRHSHRVLFASGLMLASLNLAASCAKKSDPNVIKETSNMDQDLPAPSPSGRASMVKKIPTLDDVSFPEDPSAPTQMPLTLLNGKEPLPGERDTLARPNTTPLDVAASKALLSRLEPLVEQEGDQVAFAKRPRSTPPLKSGEVVTTAFPPPEELAPPADATDAQAAQGALTVLRHAPDGDVPVAPLVSITFSQPMVPVSSHAEIARDQLPVTLSPEVPGSWRWVGAKTLLFEPEQARMPMATEYTLSLKEGVKSALGKTFEAAPAPFAFTTPPVTVEQVWPQYGTWPRDQIVFMRFDQRVDRAAILEHLSIKGGLVFGSRSPVLASAAEVEADEQIRALAAQAEPDHWIAFKADAELPYDAEIRVTLRKGAPSAEGSRLTTEDQEYSFRTYGPLKINEARCGWGECTPQTPFYFTFSNTLDKEFDPSTLKVEPSYPGMEINNYGAQIYIQGRKPGRRKYTVTFPASTKDVHGQTLGEEKSYTFDVGADEPMLSATGSNFVVLDPSSAPQFTFFTVNYDSVRLRAYAVDPKSDWSSYLEWHNDWDYSGKHEKKPPGKLLTERVVKIESEPDTLTPTQLALGKELGEDNVGHLVLEITPESVSKGSTMPEYRPRLRTWVEATKIGLDAFVDSGELIGWATSLESGEPLSGVELSLVSSEAPQKSDDKGLVKLALPATTQQVNMLLAKKGSDVAMLPENTWGSYSSWQTTSPYDQMRFFIFDDRGMYRPKEEVHLKGWMRRYEEKEGGDIALPEETVRSLSYVAYDAMNIEIAKGTAPVDGLGGFDFAFTLPDTPNLGYAYVQLSVSGTRAQNNDATHSFQIQEFRRPEFEVKASAPEGPFVAGGEATVSVTANYYAGGALPGAETSWTVSESSAHFTPPNQEKYTFGSWIPWWMSWGAPSPIENDTQSFSGKTDVLGEHLLKLEFGLSAPPRPLSVRAQATVMDVNRQAWTSTATLLVHPSEHYVGLRSEKYFVNKGEPLEIKAVISDLDGNLLAERPLKVRAARVSWKWKDGEYTEELSDPQDCEVMTSTTESTCTFSTAVGGTYKIMATTLDDFGRANYTEITRWVSGGDRPTSRRVEQERVEIIPDRDDYRPGDTARLLVQSPFVPAEGILTLRRSGIVEERRFTLSESTTTLEIPIKSGHIPNLYAQVDLVGSAPRLDEEGEPDESLPRRPAYASGSINLPVPPMERTLSVELTPEQERLEPASDTSVSVLVKDAEGNPVPDAEVALVVVDESILALSSYAMADPIALFYAMRPPGASDYHLRGHIELVDPKLLREAISPQRAPGGGSRGGADKSRMLNKGSAERGIGMADAMPMAAAAPMEDAEFAPKSEVVTLEAQNGDASGSGGETQAIAVRSNFNPLAAFAPAVKTDAAGRAELLFKMPDNLTRYRIMAVAVEGGRRFGKGESAVTARLPLMVRPSAPRFLNFGDRFELPVVLQNQTDEPLEVKVASRATNVEMISAQGYMLTIPANERVEVRFPATTAMAGTARFQVAASAGSWSDAATFDLPVWTPATSEAFATYGVIDEASVLAQPVKTPGEVWPQFGQLEVTTSSTALQSLTDAFLYLYHYDYQCAEQISSRMISVAALRDVLTAFKAEGMPSEDEVKRSMKRDIEELISRQNGDGGFGFWRRGQPSWPYVSLHAAHALTRAHAKGYEVDERARTSMLNYLRDIENYIPSFYSKWTRDHISAYALYVRALNSDRDAAKARALIKGLKSLEAISFEAVGWLLEVMTGDKASDAEVKEIKRFLNNRVTETAGAAHFAENVDMDQGYLIMHSDRAADAIILEAMIDDEPTSDLIPKIVKGLLAHRKKGRWSNTQENAFVLLALDKYFNTFEKETPDFVARVWLGDTYAGDHTFKGRTTEEHQIDIPMSYLAKEAQGESRLLIQKDGKKGRLYYRIGMTYAPKDLNLEPADHGFVVERAYEPVDDDGDVKRNADGTWEIKAGAKVKIKLTMVAPTRRYHVALVDPLPAGFESLNPALSTTEDIPMDPSMNTGDSWWWWSRPWFEHQNMRDERTEAFTSLLWGGVHTYVYYARATTPGEFVVPPTKAEEMYSPETFGRTGTDRVKIVD